MLPDRSEPPAAAAPRQAVLDVRNEPPCSPRTQPSVDPTALQPHACAYAFPRTTSRNRTECWNSIFIPYSVQLSTPSRSACKHGRHPRPGWILAPSPASLDAVTLSDPGCRAQGRCTVAGTSRIPMPLVPPGGRGSYLDGGEGPPWERQLAWGGGLESRPQTPLCGSSSQMCWRKCPQRETEAGSPFSAFLWS